MTKGIIQYPGTAAEERFFFKAALHTHTKNSDGSYTPEQVIDLYRNAGYDVLAFSDHRFVNKISGLDGKGMTLICGVELHPLGPHNQVWHILSLNVPEDFKNTNPATGQDAVNSVNGAGGIAFVAHPHWCGFTPEEVLSLHDFAGIEVFNNSCVWIGREYSMEIWDELGDLGFSCPALAVDDMHGDAQLYGGWTMIAAKSNSVNDIMDALKHGMFYASEGPEIKSMRIHDGIFEAEFSPCTKALLLGQRMYGCGGSTKPQAPVTSFKVELNSLPKGFLRFQICDANGKHAWGNPFLNPAGYKY